ncbi:MAG: HAD-IA family hydrolase [Marinicellaceae bacterium]
MKGFLFDLDGTLVDTAVDMISALKILAAENDIFIDPNYSDYKELITHGSKAIVCSIFGHLTNSEIKKLQTRYLEIYKNRLTNNSGLFKGINLFIENLDNKNIPWGIVTNKPEYLAKPLIKSLNQLNNCQILIGGDTTNQSKPHPKPILTAIKSLGIDPKKSWYIGDAQSDIVAANAANMNSAVALWGYLSKTDKPDNWQANQILKHTNDLLNL